MPRFKTALQKYTHTEQVRFCGFVTIPRFVVPCVRSPRGLSDNRNLKISCRIYKNENLINPSEKVKWFLLIDCDLFTTNLRNFHRFQVATGTY
jgi:hypothetical protein